ncbi:putative GAL4-like Zn(II)2Cys6 (or C6 zinc) binuclear cluster DNA-binding domain [Lyophyllum shimeji]|uniref:GAL4-like Zn(II)2Cys6 (Or C6 zinc) binuclear cluster DNA-binding domain n=1 Tax=Lyophyllum shimeji TaxID=47721 RepID=A0A9P3PZP4_LYOSH|nr:putative GAL4-like Zn(II)2Cys6 (or C6 zinc) binuclear cluster DNA-binding domain [Lyophyllum shimeji]
MSNSSQSNAPENQPPREYPRTPRRTPMACQFCRGRKLKCDGLRPSCSNCNRRGYPCNYIPVNAPQS